MSKLFTDGKLQSFERMMQQPNGNAHKGGGVQRGYNYTAKDVSCKYCAHFASAAKGCRADECVCIEERRKAGVV